MCRDVMMALRLVSFLLCVLLVTLPARSQDLPELQRGDVIFQTSRSGQSLAILEATGSRYTHVGIIDFDDRGAPMVLEAAQTTRATPLSEWITRGVGQAVAIYRLEGLDGAEALAVTRAARQHIGKGYDPYFYRSEDALYCSELVHIAFRDALGLRLGKVQTLADLDLGSAAARDLISDRWPSHPACADGAAQDAESCLALIRAEPLVTPEALAQDARLRLIHSSF